MSNHHGGLSGSVRNASGFSLIEMVITILIVGIVAGTSAVAMGNSFKAYMTAQVIAPLSGSGRLVMERIRKELRNTMCSTISRPNGDRTLQLTDTNGRIVLFHQAGTTTNAIYMTFNNDNVNWLLASNVQADSLRFTWTQCDGAGDPTPPLKPGLVTVSFTMRSTMPDGETITLPFRTSVYVRSTEL
ncbi:MAG: prepilin-type N-terminal cleavage/methylation domain-containing protein [Magnetococcales bacterium]|nr:prepilin-type N-terminal cleavage/methylation domain-containing protein [Magnetococcales bacterium]